LTQPAQRSPPARPLGDIAAAEQAGQTSAREELGKDLLRAVERASRRKRDAETEYEQAITRAATLGLAHREIATAAQVAHGTIRSILTRSPASTNDTQPPAEQDSHNGDQQHTTP
jgi:DNA-directed RNA polymerase specialized sigma24 family protein